MLDIHLVSLSLFSSLENHAVVFMKQDTIWRDVNSPMSEHKCREKLAGFPVSASQKFQFVGGSGTLEGEPVAEPKPGSPYHPSKTKFSIHRCGIYPSSFFPPKDRISLYSPRCPTTL